MIKSRSSNSDAGKRHKSGRFNLVKRVKARRRASSAAECFVTSTTTTGTRSNDDDRHGRGSRVVQDLVLKQVQSLDSPSSVVTCDVLGRESISTLDTERDDDDYCESVIDTQDVEEEQLPVTTSVELITHAHAQASQAVTLSTWLHDVDALVHSKEMSALMSSSGTLVLSAAKTAVHVATLPITLPLHVASSTTNMVVGTCTFALDVLCSTVDRTILHSTEQEGQDNDGDKKNHGIFPFLLGAVGKIKSDLGATIVGLVVPPPLAIKQQQQQSNGSVPSTPCRRNRRVAVQPSTGSDRDGEEEFLERLRLHPSPPRPAKQDVFPVVEKKLPTPPDVNKLELETHTQTQAQQQPSVLPKPSHSPSHTSVSKYLLRVCDLGLVLDNIDDDDNDNKTKLDEKVYHIDLSKEFYDKTLTNQALDALVHKGLALLASCPNAKFTKSTGHQIESTPVHWKPEGSTEKLLRKKAKLSSSEWITLMEKEVLVWSGKLCAKDVHKADVPVFLSRGMVPLAPRAMLHLFWDDSRTKSYNKFSLGRSTSMELQDESPTTTQDGTTRYLRKTKVVQSETQVPFTGFTVVMSTLMHARQIDSPDGGECFVIVSRSLSPGGAGLHVGRPPSFMQETKNELLWGVNVLRTVPGRSDLTDLTSISQVSSSLVVQFLAHRVGIMAVESCYNAMRSA